MKYCVGNKALLSYGSMFYIKENPHLYLVKHQQRLQLPAKNNTQTAGAIKT